MAIQIHLEEILRARGMTSKELCAKVGITEANLSILRSGKAKGVKGQVAVSSASVKVEVDLPFLLRPMKGMIGGKVEEKLNELMG